MGPLARADLRESLHRQVIESVSAGARLLLGGDPLPGRGFYYPSTVLDGVRPGMPAYHEELFGPVVAVLRARDEADALRLANDTRYGLRRLGVVTRCRPRRTVRARHPLRAGVCERHGAQRPAPAVRRSKKFQLRP